MNIDVKRPTMKPDDTKEDSICTSVSGAVIKSMLNRSIQSVIGYSSWITVDCEDAVVTLNGHFDNLKDKNSALRVALNSPCIRKVIDKTH